MTSCQLEISCGGSVYTTEIGQHCHQGCCFSFRQPVCQHTGLRSRWFNGGGGGGCQWTQRRTVSLPRDFWGGGCLWHRYSGVHLATPGRDRQLSGGPGRKNKTRNCPGRWTRGAYGWDPFQSIKDACLNSIPPHALGHGSRQEGALQPQGCRGWNES